MTQVLKTSMHGATYAVYHNPNSKYEFKACMVIGRKKYWLDEFETFNDAAMFVINSIYVLGERHS